MTLTIQRGLDTKPFPLPVTPDLAPRDDGGVIGVKLGANAKVTSFASECSGLWYFRQQHRCCSSIDALDVAAHMVPLSCAAAWRCDAVVCVMGWS